MILAPAQTRTGEGGGWAGRGEDTARRITMAAASITVYRDGASFATVDDAVRGDGPLRVDVVAPTVKAREGVGMALSVGPKG